MMQFILKVVQVDGLNKPISGFREMELSQKLNILMLVNNNLSALNLQELLKHHCLT